MILFSVLLPVGSRRGKFNFSKRKSIHFRIDLVENCL